MIKKLALTLLVLLSPQIARCEITGIVDFPGGSNGEVQFNGDGTFASDPDFTFSTSTNRLSVSSAAVTFLDGSTASLRQIRFSDGTVQTSSPTNAVTSVTAGYGLSGGGSGGSLTVDLETNVTNYIQNTSSLQSGATVYVASATITRVDVATITYWGTLAISTPGAAGAVAIFNHRGHLGIGGNPDNISPNFNEMIHIEGNSDAGAAAVETIIYNNGTGGVRHTVQAGCATCDGTLNYFGAMGTGSPGTWWTSGPDQAETAYIDTEGVKRFLLRTDTGDNYFYTSASSGSWRFFTGADTGQNYALLISSQGYLSMPQNPCVSATGATQSNVTGDGTIYTVQFTTERKDQSASFNAVSTFTAPVAGMYNFNIRVIASGLVDVTHTDVALRLVTSNASYLVDYLGNVPDLVSDITMGNPVLADMEEGDTAYVTLTVNGASKVVDVLGSSSSNHFSVVLVN